jgi:hypothetical protein
VSENISQALRHGNNLSENPHDIFVNLRIFGVLSDYHLGYYLRTVMIKSGKRYKIISVETGFVVDLSGVDNKSIIGWHDHGRDNQKVCTAHSLNTLTRR